MPACPSLSSVERQGSASCSLVPRKITSTTLPPLTHRVNHVLWLAIHHSRLTLEFSHAVRTDCCSPNGQSQLRERVGDYQPGSHHAHANTTPPAPHARPPNFSSNANLPSETSRIGVSSISQVRRQSIKPSIIGATTSSCNSTARSRHRTRCADSSA